PIKTVNWQCTYGLQAVADVAAAIKSGFYEIGKFILLNMHVHACENVSLLFSDMIGEARCFLWSPPESVACTPFSLNVKNLGN
ncbi:hypothetical protein PJO48_29690, partial [Mycobacterium kansasii]